MIDDLKTNLLTIYSSYPAPKFWDYLDFDYYIRSDTEPVDELAKATGIGEITPATDGIMQHIIHALAPKGMKHFFPLFLAYFLSIDEPEATNLYDDLSIWLESNSIQELIKELSTLTDDHYAEILAGLKYASELPSDCRGYEKMLDLMV